jgi:hypothetical protein
LNDIAILKLAEQAPLNNYIQPACLPSVKSLNYPPVEVASWAVGWGWIKFNQNFLIK